MRDSAIRHVSVCDERSLIAAALFESTVQIWNWDKAQQIGEFETVLDFGGRRLSLAVGGTICVTGSWGHGLAAYSIPNGECLWRRPDLTKIQLLTTSASGQEIYCGFDKGPVAVVDGSTGAVSRTVRNALRLFSSRITRYELLQERDRYRIMGEHESDIRAKSFTLHDAALSPDRVCLSEPDVGIRCIDVESGTQLWHHPDLWTDHLALATKDFNFYCVAMMHTPPHDCSLVRLAPNLIECDQLAFLGPCWEAAFSPSGNVLVTMRGEVYETCTGRLLTQLDFPQCDYPDK